MCSLPKGWEVKKLGEVCDILDKLRKPITKRNRVEGEYPYYGATGILSYVHEYIFDEKLVLIGEDGAKWKSGDNSSFIVSGKYWVNNHAHVIRPIRNSMLDEWVVNFLNFSDLTQYITGMTVPKLNQKKMKNIPIPLPPLPEQKRIVAILDQAFTAIDQAKANTEKNLKNARELFQSKLQETFANGKLKIDNGEWEEKKLGEVCDFIRGPFGGSLKKSIFVNNGIAVYEQKHAIHDQFDEIRYFITDDKFKEMQRFELFSGDLIMSCSGTMGKTAIVPEYIKKGIINQALLKLTTSKKLEVEYLNIWMGSKTFQKNVEEYAQGAAIKNVASVKTLKQIKIPLPMLSEQKRIVKKLDVVSTETKKLEAIYQRKITCLDELKKSILQKAFSGEL